MDSEDQPSLQKRVFVGAVPVKMDEKTLRDYFASFGHIDYFKLGRNKKNQEPLGFAFVEFRDEAVTRRVLETKHHLQGREIDVKRFALDKDIDKQQQDVLRRKVYVKGLPPACDQTRLFEVFGAFGPVDKAFILYNHKNGSSRGFGFVEFVEEASVAKAVAQKVTICGKDIQVSLAVERHKGKKTAESEKEAKQPLKKLTTKQGGLEESQTASCSLTPVQKAEGFLHSAYQCRGYSATEQESDHSKSSDTVPEDPRPPMRRQACLAIGSVPFRPEPKCTLAVEVVTGSFRSHLAAVGNILHSRPDEQSPYRFNRRVPHSSQYFLFSPPRLL